MFSLESPHGGDSNEYTQYTIFNIKKKITLNYPKSAGMGFSKGLENEFQTAMVNKPSVFEPFTYTCIWRKQLQFDLPCLYVCPPLSSLQKYFYKSTIYARYKTLSGMGTLQKYQVYHE